MSKLNNIAASGQRVHFLRCIKYIKKKPKDMISFFKTSCKYLLLSFFHMASQEKIFKFGEMPIFQIILYGLKTLAHGDSPKQKSDLQLYKRSTWFIPQPISPFPINFRNLCFFNDSQKSPELICIPIIEIYMKGEISRELVESEVQETMEVINQLILQETL